MDSNKTKNNILIIGAGPAGIAAGIELCRNGYNCIILDRASFPRKKACGGIITPKTKRLLEYLINKLPELKGVDKVYVNTPRGEHCYNCGERYYSVLRYNFDMHLLIEYRELGGILIEGCKIKQIDTDRKIVSTEKSEYIYDWLIIANGGGSRIKYNNLKKPVSSKNTARNYIGLSAIVDTETDSDGIRIFLDKRITGYGWQIPCGGQKMNIGFGQEYKDKTKLKITQKWLEAKLSVNNVKYHGQFIPITAEHCNKFIKRSICRNVLYVGEAGYYIDALTGEGLFFALYTGVCAAKLITNDISLKDYRYCINTVRRIIKGSKFTKNLLWGRIKFLPFLLWLSKRMPKLNSHLTDHLILNYHYNYFSAFLSPIICYLNIPLRFNYQRKLMRILKKKIRSYSMDDKLDESYQIKHESALITQAGFMTAVFSFSTTALFTVWQVGLQYIARVPEWEKHLGIGIITAFLLISILNSVGALFQNRIIKKKDADGAQNDEPVIDIESVRINNALRSKKINRSIFYFKIALALVFLAAGYFGIRYYILYLFI